MKVTILIVVFVMFQIFSFGQKDYYTNKVDEEVYKNILKKVSNQTDSFAKTLNEYNYFGKKELKAFHIDTFRINAICNERMNIDFYTNGMNTSILQLMDEYDKLLNKYYKLLLAQLNAKDKKILQLAQRAWLMYKDLEIQFNNVVRNDEYSGGGTIQSNLFVGRNLDIIKQRAEELFNYYYTIFWNKN